MKESKVDSPPGMEGKRNRGLLGGLALLVLTLALAAPAHASSITQISSYTDPRGAMPNHPGTLWKALYGPFTIPAATSPSQPGQLHNVPTTEPLPTCTNCRITDMVPELVFSDGSTANMQQGILLHHFVFFNPANQALACSNAMSEPFWGSGNERTPLHLPSPYGYGINSANVSMLTHLVNLNTQAKTVYVQVIYRTRPNSETEPTRPLWLDIDSFCNGGDSEYTIPTGYSDTHVDWTSTIDGRVINAWGHLHDIDIIDSNPCQTHCPERGGGIALSAEVRGGPSSDYFGPIPPNNPPPADITGATLCRSEGSYGTSYGLSHGGAGHLDTMSQCGIFSEVPAGAQPEMYPASAAYSFEGYPIRKGQVIRLHSEYENDSGVPKTDVMGIMNLWVAFADPYPRPKGATPIRASLVPAYKQCTASNRTHGAPLAYPSCNPPALASSYLTTGSPDANGAAAGMVGSVKVDALAGDPATAADEADVRFAVSVTDVRRSSDLSDYAGQLQVKPALRITDRYNGPGETGTVSDTSFPVTVPCTATSSTAIGGSCAATTTADAVTPGTVKESRRAVWQLDQVKVFDGGPDGVVSTADNTLFAVQGVFVP
jgi:hypothetical protein